MRVIRSKFSCSLVKQEQWGQEVTLHAVCGKDDKDNEENNQFAEATPNGTVQLTISNPSAQDFFKEGKLYYLDVQESPDQYLDHVEPKSNG